MGCLAEAACGASSTVCAYWAEFDDDVYGCYPVHDLSNVLTPMKLVGTLTASGVHYPPPSPPPPEPPSPPRPPPPPPMHCMDSKLPLFNSELQALSPTNSKCWQWVTATDGADTWPPEVAHRNQYESSTECTGVSSVTRTIVRETFRMFNPRSRLDSTREELMPTGGPYPNCEQASSDECCLARHQVSYDASTFASTTSGCAARCLLERRNGFDES